MLTRQISWIRRHRTPLMVGYLFLVLILISTFALIYVRFFPSTNTLWGSLYWSGAFVVLLLFCGLGLALGRLDVESE